MPMTFLEMTAKVLEDAKRPLSPSEIWKLATISSYDKQLRSQGKTPAQTLYAAIFTDARDNPNTQFVKVGDRPARYYLKSLAQERQPEELEQAASVAANVPEKYTYKELHLHPFLARFAHTRFAARSKTIRHNTSKRGEFGEWVHPDMIGIYYPDWRNEVRDLSALTDGLRVKFFSFEIKKELSFANLRESFFQAVSNSSWAHEGYLAASDISTDEDFRTELRRLSASFGIGIIEIDIEEPNSSDVLMPAKERDTPDWDALDKLAMNKDVQSLLTRIRNDLQTREIRLEHYDAILDPEQLVSSIPRNTVTIRNGTSRP